MGPCCAVPDIGGPTNRHFVAKPQSEWADVFLKCVKDEHNIDEMIVFPEDEPTPPPSVQESDEEENSDESQNDNLEWSEDQNSDWDANQGQCEILHSICMGTMSWLDSQIVTHQAMNTDECAS